MSNAWEEVKRLKVGVLLGGNSQEREISLRSGEAIFQALQRLGLNTVRIDPAQDVSEQLEQTRIQFAFLALHGHGGEDGFIQSILESRGIPYTGSDPHASALAFDKYLAKLKLVAHGIPTPRFVLVTRGDWKEALELLRFPVFIKPLCEGSSIGVEWVADPGDFEAQIKESLQHYPQLIVEEKVAGRELTVGILGSRALPVIELRPHKAFYDYEAKYTKGMTEYLVPAPLEPEVSELVQQVALQAHHVLGLRDLSRVDIMLDSRSNPFILEANTIPGFTETSLLPKAARCVGLDFDQLCRAILELAWTRGQSKPSVIARSVSDEANRPPVVLSEAKSATKIGGSAALCGGDLLT